MNVELTVTIGKNKFKISEAVESHKDFMEKVSFFSNLPETGPNGENDLELSVRHTQKGVYYSIVSKQAGMELQLGQSQKRPGELYTKEWVPLYNSNNNITVQTPVQNNTQESVPLIGDLDTQVTTTPEPVQVNTVPTIADTGSVDQEVNDVLSDFGIEL